MPTQPQYEPPLIFECGAIGFAAIGDIRDDEDRAHMLGLAAPELDAIGSCEVRGRFGAAGFAAGGAAEAEAAGKEEGCSASMCTGASAPCCTGVSAPCDGAAS